MTLGEPYWISSRVSKNEDVEKACFPRTRLHVHDIPPRRVRPGPQAKVTLIWWSAIRSRTSDANYETRCTTELLGADASSTWGFENELLRERASQLVSVMSSFPCTHRIMPFRVSPRAQPRHGKPTNFVDVTSQLRRENCVEAAAAGRTRY